MKCLILFLSAFMLWCSFFSCRPSTKGLGKCQCFNSSGKPDEVITYGRVTLTEAQNRCGEEQMQHLSDTCYAVIDD